MIIYIIRLFLLFLSSLIIAIIASSSDKMTSSNNEDEVVKCPFAKLGGPNPHAKIGDEKTSETEEDDNIERPDVEKETNKGERCPWPFIFFHDPKTGMRDWQSWAVLGLVLCWGWSKLQDEAMGEKDIDRCPWPFIFFHDPITGLKDWQSWAVIGTALCWRWSRSQK